jgi:ATP-dependent RNA helicase DeaD
MTTTPPAAAPSFRDLGLAAPLLKALDDVGYESPSPIQAATIPPLLEGRDLVGQAQTGTGKTAAFALPVLSRIDLRKPVVQALVLTPTRELAIQVAEAFQKYAAHLPGFHVLPIYGGQSYGPQLSSLKRGAHVVVGTPGRVIDHMERGTLRLDTLKCLVLDEADEMLRMGFIEEVEKILKQTPPTRQVALFSATMPPAIRRIAQTHLKSPAEITIRGKTSTVANTRQRYWMTTGSKIDALTRILEAEPFDGMIIFTRTKIASAELAQRLEARGFAVAPLNGDLDQRQRERTVARLKSGDLDIIVATDIAARGLDVDRISHVINYDIPSDTEAYIHRIGRTGRAGRSGEAILFVAPRERHMLKMIERATRQNIAQMELPSADSVNNQRIAKFKDTITQTLRNAELADGLRQLQTVVEQYEREYNISAREVAAALAHLVQGAAPPLTAPAPSPVRPAAPPREEPRGHPMRARDVGSKTTEERPSREREHAGEKPKRPKRHDVGMESFRIEVGAQHGVKTGNIVGAIASEAGLDGQFIGRVQIFDDHSIVELPEGIPKEIFHGLKKVWVSGRQLQISKVSSGAAPEGKPKPHGPGKTKHS